jgi:hypothetical protein
MLAADGIPPGYIASQTTKLTGDLVKLTKGLRELGQLEANILAETEQGRDVSALEKRRDALQREVESNKLYPMHQSGLLSAPPTELLGGQAQGPNAVLRNLFRQGVEKGREVPVAGPVVKGAGRVFEELYGAPGTRSFQAILLANSVSDQLGRAVKFTYDVERRGVDPDTALNESLDYFVYYSEESGATMTAINEYGLMMFTRYYLRIQKAMARLVGKKAATALSIAWLDNLLFEDTNLQGLTHGSTTPLSDYFLNTEKFFDKADPDRWMDIPGKAGEFTVLDYGKDVLNQLGGPGK